MCILQTLSQSFRHSLSFLLRTKGQSGYKCVSWQKGNMNAVGRSLLIGMQGNDSRETEFYSCLHTVFTGVSYYLLILNCPDASFMHPKSMFVWFVVLFKILIRAQEDTPQSTTSNTTWHPGSQRESLVLEEKKSADVFLPQSNVYNSFNIFHNMNHVKLIWAGENSHKLHFLYLALIIVTAN